MTWKVLRALLMMGMGFIFGTVALNADATPILVGHRGNGENISRPENSLDSLGWALGNGAHEVEFDVQITGDAKMVVFHDEDLSRMTNCTGLIKNKTLGQIKACDLEHQNPNDHGLGDHPPSLRQTLHYLNGSDARLHVELKDDWSAAQIRRLADEIYRQGLQSYVIVSSFDKSNLTDLKAYRPKIMRQLIWSSPSLPSVTYVKRHAPRLALKMASATPSAVKRYQDSGIHVAIWTGKTETDYARMKQLAPKRLVVDNVHRYRLWASR